MYILFKIWITSVLFSLNAFCSEDGLFKILNASINIMQHVYPIYNQVVIAIHHVLMQKENFYFFVLNFTIMIFFCFSKK